MFSKDCKHADCSTSVGDEHEYCPEHRDPGRVTTDTQQLEVTVHAEHVEEIAQEVVADMLTDPTAPDTEHKTECHVGPDESQHIHDWTVENTPVPDEARIKRVVVDADRGVTVYYDLPDL